MRSLCVFLLWAAAAQPATVSEAASLVAKHADEFARKATGAVTSETLVQHSYGIPPHSRFAIGVSAKPLYAQYLVHELVSEYGIGPLKKGGPLVEHREVVSLDGKPVRGREIARKAIEKAARESDARTRKRKLEELARLGLTDVATDFGLLLLAFTSNASASLEWAEAGTALVGVDEAFVFEWRQTSGGALEFIDGKQATRPMRGRIWIRRSDDAPLRIHASIEHPHNGSTIRDEASVDYVVSAALGCAVPASVVHRHWIDGRVLTENLYTYGPFRLFTTDSRIEYKK